MKELFVDLLELCFVRFLENLGKLLKVLHVEIFDKQFFVLLEEKALIKYLEDFGPRGMFGRFPGEISKGIWQ